MSGEKSSVQSIVKEKLEKHLNTLKKTVSTAISENLSILSTTIKDTIIPNLDKVSNEIKTAYQNITVLQANGVDKLVTSFIRRYNNFVGFCK